MTFRELQRLISKRYNLDAATASETASDLIKDNFRNSNFKDMTPRQIDKALTLLEEKER